VSYTSILLERDGPVATLVVNRADKRNALNATVRAEMLDALDDLRADDEVRVVLFTGAGDKAFVAGADIQEFVERTPLEQRRAMAGPRIFEEVANFPRPTIAVINGLALGGGCELALACDFRIASDTARLGQPEINLGLIPGGGGTQRLPRLVGSGQAMRLVLTGDLIDAADAQRMGLVEIVVAAGELRSGALEIARRIAAKSPLALQMAKAAVRAAAETPLSAGLAYETELFLACFTSEDKQEGISAFFAKRPPEFRGR